ncbi:MAG: ATP-binding protein [Legionellales bacterium]|jgi:hypothetical protein
MDIQFSPHNTHLENAETFARTDPHLRRLYAAPYVYHSPIIAQIPVDEPGIIILGGGRQIGKTTLLKQWMEKLLQQGIPADAICFYSGELIPEYRLLYEMIQRQLQEMSAYKMKYFILDEVTYIPNWDKAIKYLADSGLLDNVVLVLSGSDLIMMQEARKRFPGRRGKADQVDFHYYPLSFREVLQLKQKLPENNNTKIEDLYIALQEYLIHGGFLTAINEYAVKQSISKATLTTYSDWIRGDLIKHGKNELFLKDIVQAIIKHYATQVSWNKLEKELSINSVQTVIDYIELLVSMDALFVQSALIEDKLKPAPKKEKKHMFCDPFIYHALRAWIHPDAEPFVHQIFPAVKDSELCSHLVESCVITHFRRFFPTYYIKAEGEVDIAYIHQEKFWPVEVKWTQQLRSNDLKQIKKYKNSVIYAKVNDDSFINEVPVVPLPIALMNIDLL